jgi:hypothetical protein
VLFDALFLPLLLPCPYPLAVKGDAKRVEKRAGSIGERRRWRGRQSESRGRWRVGLGWCVLLAPKDAVLSS